MASTVTLKGANPTPAQTWNHLRINDITLELPAAPEAPLAAPVAAEFADVRMVAGDALVSWLDASAAERDHIEVEAHTEETLLVEVGDGVAATDVLVGEGARVRIVLVGSPEATGGSVLRVDAAKDAHVELREVVAAGPEATFVDATGIRLAEHASADVRHYALSGRMAVLGFACETAGKHADYDEVTRYLVQPGCQLDMNFLARMTGPDTTADLFFSGVLEEGGTKRLADTIDLVRGAKGAEGHENEVVLVTGERVHNYALPSVLCDEEDVVGTHGATIGSINEDQRTYLAIRGLDEADANALFVRSVFDDALAFVPEAAETILEAAEAALGEDAAEELALAAGIEEED